MCAYQATGFPKKDARFLKIQNITNLLCDDNDGKIKINILAIGRLLWETLYFPYHPNFPFSSFQKKTTNKIFFSACKYVPSTRKTISIVYSRALKLWTPLNQQTILYR